MFNLGFMSPRRIREEDCCGYVIAWKRGITCYGKLDKCLRCPWDEDVNE